MARELQRIPKDLHDKFQPSPDRPQRKRKPRYAIGLFKLLASYHGSQFVFQPFGTFDLWAMQVCNPQEIRQAHSQYPPHSRVSLEKTPSLTWLRTKWMMHLLNQQLWHMHRLKPLRSGFDLTSKLISFASTLIFCWPWPRFIAFDANILLCYDVSYDTMGSTIFRILSLIY